MHQYSSALSHGRFFMNRILLALLLCLGFDASALADGKVFPPDNCSATKPFMAFNGVADNGNTYCSSGQDIFHNAIPACAPDQIVAYDGTQFYCTDNTLNPPTCAPGEVLTSNGSSFQCTATLTVPTCGPGEVLTGSGGTLTCVAQASAGPSGSWCGLAADTEATGYTPSGGWQTVANCQGQPIVTTSCHTAGNPQCVSYAGGYGVLPNCPSGYTFKAYFSGSDSVNDHYFGTCIKN
jgi:hypothetical protein